MTEPRTTSARTGTTGTVLQFLLGLALVADLVFLGFLGIRLSDRAEQTGIALAGLLTLVLVGVLFRLTRRIGSGTQAVEPG
jgi:amino acid transporter